MKQPQTLKIDDIEYVRKDQIKNNEPAETYEGMKYVVVRTYSAGVFSGYLKSTPDSMVVEYFKQVMESYGKPYLILQHRYGVGDGSD